MSNKGMTGLEIGPVPPDNIQENFIKNIPIEVFQGNNSENSKDFLNLADSQIASTYAKFTHGKLTPTEVLHSVVEDDFYKKGLIIPVIASVRNSQTHALEFAATLRYVRGQEKDGLPIEAVGLMGPVGDWYYQREGVSPARIGEIGRFAVSEKFRPLSARLLGSLTRKAFELHVRETELHSGEVKHDMYFIAPPNIVSMYKSEHMDPEEIPADLRWGNPKAEEVYNTFDGYWKREGYTPRLYRFTPRMIDKYNISPHKYNGG